MVNRNVGRFLGYSTLATRLGAADEAQRNMPQNPKGRNCEHAQATEQHSHTGPAQSTDPTSYGNSETNVKKELLSELFRGPYTVGQSKFVQPHGRQ